MILKEEKVIIYHMKKIIFDANSYDQLAAHPETIEIVRHCIEKNKITILITRTIMDELKTSPFKGVPDWFFVQQIPESVFLLDYCYLDDARLGDGEVYEQHKGTSLKFKDALIADFADSDCDLLITDDKRCKKRLNEVSQKCKAMNFNEFKNWLEKIKEFGSAFDC